MWAPICSSSKSSHLEEFPNGLNETKFIQCTLTEAKSIRDYFLMSEIHHASLWAFFTLMELRNRQCNEMTSLGISPFVK